MPKIELDLPTGVKVDLIYQLHKEKKGLSETSSTEDLQPLIIRILKEHFKEYNRA